MANRFEIPQICENISAACCVSETVRIQAKSDVYSFGRVLYRHGSVPPGKVYRITLRYETRDVNGSVDAVANWLKKDGTPQARGYLEKPAPGLLRLEYHIPENVTVLELEYRMWSNGGGEVNFSMPQVECLGDSAPRHATLATAWFSTAQDRTCAKNLADILRIADNAGTALDKPDILVFSEAIYGRGVPDKTLQERALMLDSEPLAQIAKKAANYGMYIAVGVHLNDGEQIKNVALIYGRSGGLEGMYAKTHLTMCEREWGIVSGNDQPVFQLDFGRVGVLICWDHFFAEPARLLHMKGAEVVIVPTAGDTAYQSRARAIDSGAYYVMGGTNTPGSSIIINPLGETIAQVTDTEKGYSSVTVDLNQRQHLYWLSVGPCDGEGRDVYLRERRTDLYGGLSEN
ncbi:hypothetical protein AGMMS49992_20350 [Clostridia bacterium]|nr:hypothetical protein AGMMS49992_20350 [Clostridia bacterium]